MNTAMTEKLGYSAADAASDGNRFLCANGYMGLRGVAEESDSSAFPAVTLAGVYDRNGDKWREPVNAPHGLTIRVQVNGADRALGKAEPAAHRCAIDYRHGIYSRETDFGAVRLASRRIASLADCHLLADRMVLTLTEEADVVIRCGISDDIWDINGPHLFDFTHEKGEILKTEAVSGELKTVVSVAQSVKTDFACETGYEAGEAGLFRVLTCHAGAGDVLTLDTFAAVWTSLDTAKPGAAALETAARAAGEGFEAVMAAHCAAWDTVGQRSGVLFEGDDRAARAMQASQYFLNSIAPRHAGSLSIPARGLSGQTYKGAIFWDSEMFFFPMFIYTQPEVAESLLRYRIETLPGALKKAAEYGYRGAFYAWESQEGGSEGCTNFNVVDVFTHRPVRTYFRDKQIHITGDIAYALRSHYEITGDRTLLEEGGARVILECARFYLSRAAAHLDSEALDYPDVIGPDEYHERVTNNAYTNRMILHCFDSALKLETIFADRPEYLEGLIRETDFAGDWALLREAVGRVRRPRVRQGVIEQFDGYFALEDVSLETVRSRLADPREYWGGDHGVAGVTTIIKQADVIAMMALFPEKFTDEEVAANWHYYEPRTEHGSSLSACMYALTACRIGEMDKAWELFLKTAEIDILGGGKQWAGEIYIGGTHPASNGGAWMIAALGFAGLVVRSGKISVRGNLPRQLQRLSFPVTAGGKRYRVTVTKDGASVAEA